MMVCTEKKDQALQALHRVLTGARFMALTNEASSRIADVLDWAELLPRYLAATEDQTKQYRDTLVTIAEKTPELNHALAAFDRTECARW
jgi:hypothetical protein